MFIKAENIKNFILSYDVFIVTETEKILTPNLIS